MIRVGQRLREERLRQGLTIEEVARNTKIRSQFISAIERGNYKTLPSSAYVYGFVKNYISFLGLPSRELLAMFRREFDEREYIGVLPESFSGKAVSIRKIHIRRIVGIATLILAPLLIYTFFQYRAAFLNPTLIISSPREGVSIAALAVTVVGKTDPDVNISVNDIPVIVDTNGNFKKLITVFPGNASITIKAVNSFGKISTIERHVKINPN